MYIYDGEGINQKPLEFALTANSLVNNNTACSLVHKQAAIGIWLVIIIIYVL